MDLLKRIDPREDLKDIQAITRRMKDDVLCNDGHEMIYTMPKNSPRGIEREKFRVASDPNPPSMTPNFEGRLPELDRSSGPVSPNATQPGASQRGLLTLDNLLLGNNRAKLSACTKIPESDTGSNFGLLALVLQDSSSKSFTESTCHDKSTVTRLPGMDLPSPKTRKPHITRFHKHTHFPITIPTIQQSLQPKNAFTQRSHDSSDLTAILQFTTSQATLPIQKSGLLNLQTVQNETDIQAFFRAFDDIFFLGTLQETTTVRIHDTGHATAQANCVYRTIDEHTTCLITLKQEFPDDMWNYIEMLLHEMVHAFMALYSCRRKGCHMKPENMGVSGHGEAWCEGAMLLEGAVERMFGWDLNLRVLENYAYELRYTGGKVSWKVEGRWGASKREVEEMRVNWALQEP